MKKLLTTLSLLFLLIPTTANAVVNSISFSDVNSSHSNKDAIDYVKSEGVVNGYNDGTFKPDQTINRAEFTKIIIGSQFTKTEIESCTPNQRFSDVDPFLVPWIYQYSCLARNYEIINGYSDNTFRPNKPISFIEATKIISNTFGYEVEEDDVWYKPFIEKLFEKKAIPTSITELQKNITRGEMAEMVYRLKAGITEKTTVSYEDLVSDDWETYTNESLGFQLKYPEDWRVVENGNTGAMFGPTSISEDTLFNINIVDGIPVVGSYGSNNEITNIEEVTFAGDNASKVYIKNISMNLEYAQIFINKNGTIFSIGQPTLNNSDFPFDSGYNSIVVQILDSFEFFDEETENNNIYTFNFDSTNSSCTQTVQTATYNVHENNEFLTSVSINHCGWDNAVEQVFKTNDAVYFSSMPDGLGGYIPYGKYTNLYRLNLDNNSVDSIITGSASTLTDIDFSADNNFIVYRSYNDIIVKNIANNSINTYLFDFENRSFGSFKFSPNNDKIVVAKDDGPEAGSGVIYVLNLNNGTFSLYANTEAIPRIDSWLNNDEIEWHNGW